MDNVPTGSTDDSRDPNSSGSIGDVLSKIDIMLYFDRRYIGYPVKNVDMIVPNRAYNVIAP